MYSLFVCVCVCVCVDGEPGGGVGLLPDGSHPEGGEAVLTEHLQEDQESWLQCPAGAEVYPQVIIKGAGLMKALEFSHILHF